MKSTTKVAKVGGKRSVAEFIDQQIAWTEKSNLQIADECGFPKSNIVSMIRYGKTKMPMNRIGKMAKALEVDSVFFLGLVMQEYDPEGWSVMQEIIGKPVITANEVKWIEVMREVSSEVPPPPHDVKKVLQGILT